MLVKRVQQICLWIIYAGAALSLALPLYLDNSAFFPFVAPRAFVFRSATEIMLVAFLFLIATDKKYLPRLNLLNITLTLFVITAFVSSLLGLDFYRSFWGDMERGEGLLLWLHLWAFFIILSSSVRSERSWMKIFDFSAAVALLVSLFGLAQYFGLESVLQSSGSRVDGTFGNAAFFAGYLLFHIGIALYLLLSRKHPLARIYYGALAFLFGFLILASQTRGAVVGLAAGVLIAMLLLVWTNRANAKVRNASIAVIALLVAAAGLLYLVRDREWVRNSRSLQRLVTISPQTRTAQTRLATWGAGLKGFAEKPILGYGLENFNAVFNENFPPLIFEDEGSVVWFDRAHNVLVDRLVATGAVGLALYLLFVFYPFYYFIRYDLRDPEKRNIAVVFSSLIVAFFIQNLFIFETLATYTMLFLLWSFFSARLLPEGGLLLHKVPRKLWAGAFVLVLLLTGPLLWKINVAEAKINRTAAEAVLTKRSEENFVIIADWFKKALETGSYGAEEYRLRFIEFVGLELADVGEVAERVKPVLEYADEQVQRQLSDFGYNTKNLLLAMRHYNFTRVSIAGAEVERLEKAMSLLPRLIESSPTRAQVYQEAGFSQYYLYCEYDKRADSEKAALAEEKAIDYFQQAIDINPKVIDLYVNPLIFYFESGNDEGINEVLRQMREKEVSFSESHLARLQQQAKKYQRVEWVRFFSEELIERNPDDVSLLIDLALSFAYEGDRERAISLAERIKSFGPDFAQQADIFISEVNAGVYEADAAALAK